MGLDMYLSAHKFVSGYEHSGEKARKHYAAIVKAAGIKKLESSAPTAEVKVNVAYWRKANQIHAWFVSKVQDGKDDCGRYQVDREQLESLVASCKEALANKDAASSLLPSQGGFFFGSTAYDDYYFDDLKDTVEQIESILKNPSLGNWCFEYQSSW